MRQVLVPRPAVLMRLEEQAFGRLRNQDIRPLLDERGFPWLFVKAGRELLQEVFETENTFDIAPMNLGLSAEQRTTALLELHRIRYSANPKLIHGVPVLFAGFAGELGGANDEVENELHNPQGEAPGLLEHDNVRRGLDVHELHNPQGEALGLLEHDNVRRGLDVLAAANEPFPLQAVPPPAVARQLVDVFPVPPALGQLVAGIDGPVPDRVPPLHAVVPPPGGEVQVLPVPGQGGGVMGLPMPLPPVRVQVQNSLNATSICNEIAAVEAFTGFFAQTGNAYRGVAPPGQIVTPEARMVHDALSLKFAADLKSSDIVGLFCGLPIGTLALYASEFVVFGLHFVSVVVDGTHHFEVEHYGFLGGQRAQSELPVPRLSKVNKIDLGFVLALKPGLLKERLDKDYSVRLRAERQAVVDSRGKSVLDADDMPVSVYKRDANTQARIEATVFQRRCASQAVMSATTGEFAVCDSFNAEGSFAKLKRLLEEASQSSLYIRVGERELHNSAYRAYVKISSQNLKCLVNATVYKKFHEGSRFLLNDFSRSPLAVLKGNILVIRTQVQESLMNLEFFLVSFISELFTGTFLSTCARLEEESDESSVGHPQYSCQYIIFLIEGALRIAFSSLGRDSASIIKQTTGIDLITQGHPKQVLMWYLDKAVPSSQNMVIYLMNHGSFRQSGSGSESTSNGSDRNSSSGNSSSSSSAVAVAEVGPVSKKVKTETDDNEKEAVCMFDTLQQMGVRDAQGKIFECRKGKVLCKRLHKKWWNGGAKEQQRKLVDAIFKDKDYLLKKVYEHLNIQQ